MSLFERRTERRPRSRRRRLFEDSQVDYHVFFEDVTYVVKGKTSRTVVFERMNAQLPKGRRIAIMGPKRSGKTALVKLIAGVAVPKRGDVHRRGHISWPLGGQYMIAKPLTVKDNVLMTANLLGIHPGQMMDYVDEMCMLGPKKSERVKDLPKHYLTRLNLALPLVAGFDCYLIDDNLPLSRTRLPDDRLDLIRAEVLSRDLILVTSNHRVARDFADTGAVIADRGLAFCSSVEEAIMLAGDQPAPDEEAEGEEDDEEEEENVDGFW